MAAEAEIEGGAEQGAKKKGPKLLIMIGAAAAVVLLAGGAYFFLFAGKGGEATAAAQGAAEAGEHGAAASSFIFNLPSMTVNLNSEGDKGSFMKLTVALEVADESMMSEIQPRMAKIVDAFQVYLRELRKSDLEGSAGIYRLKEELLRRVNVAIAPASIESILFKEILVQ